MEIVLNKISFSPFPCLLCKLRCHAGTAAIRQRMAMVVFLTAYCTHLLLQPRFSHSLVGKRRRGGKGGREISSPPLFICGWIFCTRGILKACFPSSEACLKQLAAMERDKDSCFLVLFRNRACDQHSATSSGAAVSTLRWTGFCVGCLKSCVSGNRAANWCTLSVFIKHWTEKHLRAGYISPSQMIPYGSRYTVYALISKNIYICNNMWHCDSKQIWYNLLFF